MDYLDRVFLWLGDIKITEQELEKYFELDYSVEGDFDHPDYNICGFCKDIGEKWYDEDFIGYLTFEETLSIKEILEHVPIALDEREKILQQCQELGLDKATTTYWYSGEIGTPSEDKKYNGIHYIGEFDLD